MEQVPCRAAGGGVVDHVARGVRDAEGRGGVQAATAARATADLPAASPDGGAKGAQRPTTIGAGGEDPAKALGVCIAERAASGAVGHLGAGWVLRRAVRARDVCLRPGAVARGPAARVVMQQHRVARCPQSHGPIRGVDLRDGDAGKAAVGDHECCPVLEATSAQRLHAKQSGREGLHADVAHDNIAARSQACNSLRFKQEEAEHTERCALPTHGRTSGQGRGRRFELVVRGGQRPRG
mmetsp:Transcript_79763/g.247381  ORF Transcript_79763/g.247381 Transcript_79763/m.247381 type:complete len:238 (+) Transcript_79763:1971-2684(+)